MAFESKYYPDGDIVFHTPDWRKKLEEAAALFGEVSYSEEEKRKHSFQEQEVGLKHPQNGSYLRINDDGSIEAFTAYGTGMRINPNNTIQLFSDRVQLIGRELDIRSNANGTNLNGEVLGKGSYQSYPYKKGLSARFLEEANVAGLNTYGLEETK